MAYVSETLNFSAIREADIGQVFKLVHDKYFCSIRVCLPFVNKVEIFIEGVVA